MQTILFGGARIGFGRGHMFWEPVRGRRAVRLGQAAYNDPDNRLLNLSIMEILKRRILTVLPMSKRGKGSYDWAIQFQIKQALYGAGWPGKLPQVIPGLDGLFQTIGLTVSGGAEAVGQFSPFPFQTTKALFDISQDPTSKEIDDADQIDAFFGPIYPVLVPSVDLEKGSYYPVPDPWITQPCLDGSIYRDHEYGSFSQGEIEPKNKAGALIGMNGRFWCSPWAEGKAQATIPSPVWNVWGADQTTNLSVRAVFFGLTLSEPWGDVKPWFKNALMTDYVLSKYPFPQPFGEHNRFWSYFAVQGLRDLVKTSVPLAEEDIRVWITFSFLAHYVEMVDALNSYLKGQAKSERRKALVITIAAVAIGALVLAAALPAIIAAIASSAATALNKINAHEFQKQMADIQDAFKESDPAFSDQVGEAAAYVQRLSAALETAVDKENVTRTLSSPGLSTGLLIGGGLAAIGALALAIFRK